MMMTFLSILTFITAVAAIVLMTYAHLRVFNRPYFGKELSAQPDVVTTLKPAFIFVRHLENHHWWEVWLGSFLVRFFCKETPEIRERKTYANLYLPPNLSKPCPLVIYTHGNGATIGEAAAWLEHLVASGFALLMCEYRGFGEAGGHPQRELICRDLCYFYDEALASGVIDKEQIIIYGRSLGGGIACDLSERRPTQKLILESTYFKLKEIIGSEHLPDYVLIGKHFECAKTVETFGGKILLCHGTNDSVSPVEQANKLKALNDNATLKIFEATHGDIYQKQEYKDYVLSWLKQP
jgi:pimeloyl-ACP methyl ester carboxylesterase